MANPEHLEILKQGVEVWSQWRRKKPHKTPDLSDARLDAKVLIEIAANGIRDFNWSVSQAESRSQLPND